MKQKCPEILVKMIGQPAWDWRLNFHRPMNGRERLITAPFQTWQAMQVRIGHGLKIMWALCEVSNVLTIIATTRVAVWPRS